jgi:hypothetical protein
MSRGPHDSAKASTRQHAHCSGALHERREYLHPENIQELLRGVRQRRAVHIDGSHGRSIAAERQGCHRDERVGRPDVVASSKVVLAADLLERDAELLSHGIVACDVGPPLGRTRVHRTGDLILVDHGVPSGGAFATTAVRKRSDASTYFRVQVQLND